MCSYFLYFYLCVCLYIVIVLSLMFSVLINCEPHFWLLYSRCHHVQISGFLQGGSFVLQMILGSPTLLLAIVTLHLQMILASPTLSQSFATKDILLSQTWLQGNSFSEQRKYILKTKLRNFSVVTFIRQRKNCVNSISSECNSSEVIDPYQVWVKGEGGVSTRAEQKL